MASPVNKTDLVELDFTAFVLGRCLSSIETYAWKVFGEISCLKLEPGKPLSDQIEHYLDEIGIIRQKYMAHLADIYELVDKHTAQQDFDCAKRIETILGDCRVCLLNLVSKNLQAHKTIVDSHSWSSFVRFDGNVDRWVEFREQFEERVVNNPSMSNLERLKAFNAIINVPMKHHRDDEPFQIVWNNCRVKFDKMAVIHHVEALFGHQIQHHCSNSQDVVSYCDHHAQSLAKLGYPLKRLGAIVVDHISRVDNNTSRKGNHEQHSEILHRKEVALPDLVPAKPSSNNTKCFYCEGRHYLRNCYAFQRLPFRVRFEMVAVKWKICFICFSVYHLAGKCSNMVVCKKCQHRHNSAMHPENDTKANLKLLDDLAGQ